MTAKLNQHFVPQYLFRQFSGGERYVHLVNKASSQVVFEASVKGQCARRKYYGTQEVEDALGVLDGRHALGYRAVIREAWSDTPKGLTEDEHFWLLEGLMLQRARVPRAAANLADTSEKASLYVFREFIKASTDIEMRQQIVEAIDKGQVSIKDHELTTLLHSLTMGLQSVIGITDLSFAVLRNHTKFPFVFGDSPCIFYNRYLYGCTSRGTLGYQTPGLMILMPLDRRTQVLLYDPSTYRMQSNGPFVDVIQNSEASQLNALQVHAARDNVYFAKRDDAEYLVDLVACHRPNFRSSYSEFRVLAPGSVLIDGKPNRGEVIHSFESQLPVRLDLSFVSTKPAPPSDGPHRARSPELRSELLGSLDGVPRRMSVEQFAAELKDELEGLPGK